MLSRRNSTSGFTLIELLVVIAIIGVLASVVLASLNNARRKARDARRITDIKQLQLALTLYYDGAGAQQYPIGDAVVGACASDAYGLSALVTDGYIPSIPHDPSNPATCYFYASGTVDGLISTYHLAAVLEDSGNTAFSSDKDCSSGATNTCNASATWNGPNINDATTDCDATAGADQCYDVIP